MMFVIVCVPSALPDPFPFFLLFSFFLFAVSLLPRFGYLGSASVADEFETSTAIDPICPSLPNWVQASLPSGWNVLRHLSLVLLLASAGFVACPCAGCLPCSCSRTFLVPFSRHGRARKHLLLPSTLFRTSTRDRPRSRQAANAPARRIVSFALWGGRCKSVHIDSPSRCIIQHGRPVTSLNRAGDRAIRSICCPPASPALAGCVVA